VVLKIHFFWNVTPHHPSKKLEFNEWYSITPHKIRIFLLYKTNIHLHKINSSDATTG
jgi:hypothetical protein